MINPFKKKRKLRAEIVKVTKEKEQVKNKTAKIDKLAKDLRSHLRENNIGERLYEQMVQSRR